MRAEVAWHAPADAAEWHAIRAQRIGGSEFGLLGDDDPCAALDALDPDEQPPRTLPLILGTRLERGIRDAAGDIWPALAADEAYDGLIAARTDMPHIGYTPDGVSSAGELLEIKASGNRAGHWGRGMSTQVPYRYWLQVQYGLWVLGLERGWIIRLCGDRDGGLALRRYPVRRQYPDAWFECAAEWLWRAKIEDVRQGDAVAAITRETGFLL